MTFHHTNDDDVIRELLNAPGVWVVVGLSNNKERAAYDVARWLHYEQGRPIIPVHSNAEEVHGSTGYASISDIPDQDIKVVDCFVNSEQVGAVVDEVIANKDRLQIDAVWMQLDVVDQAAAQRAKDAGLQVVMNTCPKIEWRKARGEGAAR